MKHQVKDHGTVFLEGNPMQVARGLCTQGVAQIALTLKELHGPIAVLEFYTALLTLLALDVQHISNTETARHILSAVLGQIDQREAARAAAGLADLPPPCFVPGKVH